VPYLLVAAAALVALVGVAKLLGHGPKTTTQRAALVWGLLFGLGVVVWLVSARLP
jgi:hypothetical protein